MDDVVLTDKQLSRQRIFCGVSYEYDVKLCNMVVSGKINRANNVNVGCLIILGLTF
jgi:hypothetical protein